MRHLKVLLPLAAALLALTLVHCGKIADSTPASGTFASVYTTLKTACIECHVPGGTGSIRGEKLDFSSSTNAYTTLTDTTATAKSGDTACSTVKIVEAGNTTNSYLIGVLDKTAGINNFAGATGCQPYAAHYTDQNISAAELTSIKAWIQAGALNN